MKANFSLSFFCKDTVKKESFKSISVTDHSLDYRDKKWISDYREPIDWTVLLNILSFSIFQIFLITHKCKLQGLVDFSIWWAFSCFCNSYSKVCSFSVVKGHHADLSVNHFKHRSVVLLKDQHLLSSVLLQRGWSVTLYYLVIFFSEKNIIT